MTYCCDCDDGGVTCDDDDGDDADADDDDDSNNGDCRHGHDFDYDCDHYKTDDSIVIRMKLFSYTHL